MSGINFTLNNDIKTAGEARLGNAKPLRGTWVFGHNSRENSDGCQIYQTQPHFSILGVSFKTPVSIRGVLWLAGRQIAAVRTSVLGHMRQAQ